jgi:hypothetical protein
MSCVMARMLVSQGNNIQNSWRRESEITSEERCCVANEQHKRVDSFASTKKSPCIRNRLLRRSIEIVSLVRGAGQPGLIRVAPCPLATRPSRDKSNSCESHLDNGKHVIEVVDERCHQCCLGAVDDPSRRPLELDIKLQVLL